MVSCCSHFPLGVVCAFLRECFDWMNLCEFQNDAVVIFASSIELRRTIDVQGICDSMSLSVWPLVGCSEVIGSTASAVNFHVWVAWTGSRLAWKKFGFWFESIIIPSVLTHPTTSLQLVGCWLRHVCSGEMSRCYPGDASLWSSSRPPSSSLSSPFKSDEIECNHVATMLYHTMLIVALPAGWMSWFISKNPSFACSLWSWWYVIWVIPVIQDTFDIPSTLTWKTGNHQPSLQFEFCLQFHLCPVFPVKMFEAGVQSWRTEGRFSRCFKNRCDRRILGRISTSGSATACQAPAFCDIICV